MKPVTLKPENLHTAEEFYMFFAAIPDERWTTDAYCKDGKFCAEGHLGRRERVEMPKPIRDALDRFWNLVPQSLSINDGEDVHYQQPTPRLRILAALRDKFTVTP